MIRTLLTALLLIGLTAASIGTAAAETVSWGNRAGGAWETAVNWAPAKVPVEGDDVLVSGGTPVTFSSSATVKSLKVNTARIAVTAGILTLSSRAPVVAPSAAFSAAPAAAVTGQTVQFTDASANWATWWSWDFGDGTSSILRHPIHSFGAAGSYTVTLTAGNSNGSSTTSHIVTVTAADTAAPGSFTGSIVLGSPTATSIKANIFSAGQSGSVYLRYGTSSGVYEGQTAATPLVAGTPLVLAISGLTANSRYYYRLYYAANDIDYVPAGEHTFHTARPAGSAFSFTIQADSHLDENSSPAIYRTTLNNVLADLPDFHIDLGDTFMCEKHSAPLTAVVQTAPDYSTVLARYRYERDYFGTVSHSAPLFLVNGNHEGEAGWLNNATAENIAVWTTKARLQYYLNPVPDTFYSGDSQEEAYVGKRASWYSWHWGDALFIVLDPYWNSTDSGGRDPWGLSLGERQYTWLTTTLAASTAPFKFIFIHNLVGGLDGQMRGGIEAAPYFEWGGKNFDGSDGFTAHRPGWGMAIHQLMTSYGVTALFHGHDHIYAKQDLDGIVYQEVPQPSAVNSQSGPGLATEYHYAAGTILSSSGHIRVTVNPERVTSQYVRAWLPSAENAQQKNGQIADSWSVGAAGMPTASFSVVTTAPVDNQLVGFVDTSTGTPTAWNWLFGDGGSSTDRNPSHTYGTYGTYTVTLTVSNSTGAHTIQKSVLIGPSVPAPVASFTFSPAAPEVGQTMTFSDTSTGSATSWTWNFGDGSRNSTTRDTTHAYSAAGTYTVTHKATNQSGTTVVRQTVTVLPAGTVPSFNGSIVLGSPTAASVKANIYTPDQSGTVFMSYGTASSAYGSQTAASVLQAAVPLEIMLDNLQADTQYYYRLNFKPAGASGYSSTDEFSFHTARPPGSTFVFAIQGDSHPERAGSQFNADLYVRTLTTAAADSPDFYLTIGDDFSVDTLDPLTVTQSQVVERYTLQRPWLGLVGRSAPLFLVNGNHEQAARYLLNGTPDNVAVWAQNARNALYSQPAPDSFYSGNTEAVPYIGLLRNHFAWTWGDALFVVIDPYWGSPVCVDNQFDGSTKAVNPWDKTHGDAQFQWLKSILEGSTAKYKFVFAHHVMGTGRGGIELAGLYEWGGYNSNGTTWGFGTYRSTPLWTSTWTSPIHKLMADNHVTIFFQGHDHIWVRQQLDGVTYQTLPEPADPFYTLYFDEAFLTGDKLPNSGYTRVTVSPENVKVDYIRTWLPADEGDGKVSGSTAFSYTLP